ncbi:hypothetical protein Kyoto67A_06590 [Helicobacter pylori]
MDALYNFINDKNTNFLGKNNKLSVGLFGVKHPTQKSLALMEKSFPSTQTLMTSCWILSWGAAPPA